MTQIIPLSNKVLVSDIEQGMRQIGRIIIPDDNGTAHGVRSRWAQVYAVGKDVTGINKGDWILIKHGRWTRSHTVNNETESFKVWGVEYPDGILMVSSEKPNFDTFGDYQGVGYIDTGIPSSDYRAGLSEY